MAIIKQAKNIKQKVNIDYQLQVTGRVQKAADKVVIEAKDGNLVLSSNKKVVSQGSKESEDG